MRPRGLGGRRRNRTGRRLLAVAVVVAVVGSGAAGAGWFLLRREPSLPKKEVAAYLGAWERFDVEGMRAGTDAPPAEMDAAVTAMQEDLRITAARFTPGPIRREGDFAVAGFGAEVDLAGLGTWAYQGTLRLARADGRWRVAWEPASLHPDLGPAQRFGRTRTWPARAAILGADGTALVTAGDVVDIGLKPSGIRDLAQVQAALKQQLNVEPADVTAALRAPGVQPDHFVPVTRVRRERFLQVEPVLDPVPGIFFQRGTGRLAVADNFALHVLGRYDEVTAERLDELGSPYLVGDRVGLSGLEANFERKLAGTPAGDVQVVDAATEKTVKTVFQFPGTPPQPVRTTLDRRTQEAAEQALAGVTSPSAIVAVDPATGDVRAVVSRPLDQPFNRALAGQYPPASTFKVVTTAALLGAGARPETPIGCPAEATIGGQRFRNFEGGALGGTTFRSAFAQSCNTAFVTLAGDLADAALGAAATSFGFGASYDLGVPTAGAAFPAPRDVAERASQAIGQGRVVASPVHMATVAAAVASGGWRAPRLLADNPASQASNLDPQVVATLKDLTAEVVRTGTGTAAAVAGQQVAGKTGTGEIDGADPNRTHAWFIGYRGPALAFAVLVEGGGVGGRVAAPLAARFLAAAP